jgi:hypothetical protein
MFQTETEMKCRRPVRTKLRVFRPVGGIDEADQFLGREMVFVFFKSHFAKVGRDALDAVLGVERIVVADEVGFRLVLAGFLAAGYQGLVGVIAARTIRQMRAGRTRWMPRTKLRMNRMTKIEILLVVILLPVRDYFSDLSIRSSLREL